MAYTDGLADKIMNHHLSHLVIDDNAVAKGMNNAHIAGRAADHLFGAVAHCNDFSGIIAPHNHNRGLIDDNSLIFDVYARIIRAYIHRNIR